MHKDESVACIRILDFIASNKIDRKILNKYQAVINTCVLAYMRSHGKQSNLQNLFDFAPHIVVDNLVANCTYNLQQTNCKNELPIIKIDEQEHLDLPDETESKKLLNIDELF